jgi:hypothetical protein
MHEMLKSNAQPGFPGVCFTVFYKTWILKAYKRNQKKSAPIFQFAWRGTTFLAILPLAFSSSQAFRVFFKMFFGIVVAGGVPGWPRLGETWEKLVSLVNWVAVTGTMEFYDFPRYWHIGNVIIPTDQLHHFSEGRL